MQFLLSTSDDELKSGVPTVFKKIVKRAEELLGE